jgi:hypothetical protein
MTTYDSVSKIFRTDAVKIINLTTKRVCKLPTPTQLRATLHIDSLDMVVLLSTGALHAGYLRLQTNTKNM